jgi:hypothetical protein
LSFEGAGAATAAPLIVPQNGSTDKLVLKLKPRTAQALATAFVPRGADKPDDIVTARILYSTVGGRSNELTIDIPVRFVPWPPILFPVAALGATIGWLIPFAVTQRHAPGKDRMRALAAALLAGILAELLAMTLQTYGGDFQFAGRQIDPFQIPSAFLIGVVAGMTGFKSLKNLRKIGLSF